MIQRGWRSRYHHQWAHPGVEATLLADEADTAAYSGRLSSAREFSRQAVESAERAGAKEAAATYSPFQPSGRPCSATQTKQGGVPLWQ